jgi:hypothetical protein
MSKVITTKKINIDQLGHESNVDLNIVSEADGTFIIESSVAQKTLESFIDAHVANDSWVSPNPPKVITIENKLASVGLSIDDLKTALGL